MAPEPRFLESSEVTAEQTIAIEDEAGSRVYRFSSTRTHIFCFNGQFVPSPVISLQRSIRLIECSKEVWSSIFDACPTFDRIFSNIPE